MKKLMLVLSLFVGLSASASQDFSCVQMEKGGSYVPTTFGISLVDSKHLETLNHGEVTGLFTRNSAKNLIWTSFISRERLNLTIQVSGKMYFGRSGYVRLINHVVNGPDITNIYFCKPGPTLL